MSSFPPPKRFQILFLCTGNSGVEIYRRLGLFTALPMESISRLRLEEMTRSIDTQ